MRLLAVIALLLVLSGCAKRQENDIASFLSYEQAEFFASRCAAPFGDNAFIFHADGDSNDFAISTHSYVVAIGAYDLLEPGQMVLFEREGQYILHQVVLVDGDNFRTAGMGNKQSDGWSQRRNYIGTVIAQFYHK